MTAVERRVPDRTPADYKAEPTVNQYMMEHFKVNTYDDLFTRPCILRNTENVMIDMMERPEMARYLFEVTDAVLHRARTLGAGGGYVLAASHDISADTPPENIVAMYQPELRALTA